MYELLFHPKAAKRLNKIHPNDKNRTLNKLDKLTKTPKTNKLDTKKLVNTTNSYRLRTGDIRVIYEVDHKRKKLYIWDIDYRGNIY